MDEYTQRRIQGGLLGLSPPGPVKSIVLRGFSCPKVLSPPWKEKNLSPPPGQIPEYAPEYTYT